MKTSSDAPTQQPNYLVETACGSRVPFQPDTSYVLFRGEVVYFCCSECKEGYESNPATSCMAGKLNSK
jgi:YHS domain-containing protein